MTLASDDGTIDEEEYHLKVCVPGPIFNPTEMENSFGKTAKLLQMAFVSYPYLLIKTQKLFKITLDGVSYLLEEGKHYKIII